AGLEIDHQRPVECLAEWEKRFNRAETDQTSFGELRRSLASERRKARRAQAKIRSLRGRLRVLLARSGARTDAQFLERAQWVARRSECREMLSLAQEELRQAAGQESDLAIVEEHFEQFAVEENQQRALRLAADLER